MLVNIQIFPQTTSEKLIFDINSISKTNLSGQPYQGWYYFFYYRATGTYVYMKPDTISEKKVKYTFVSNKGNSKEYDYADYRAFFDEYGNYYAFAIDTLSRKEIICYLIKNGNEAVKSKNNLIVIGKHNGFIFFTQDENNGRALYKYDYINDKLYHGNTYYMHYGDINFTKDNKPFFLSQSNPGYPAEEIFFVIDDKEQKHYSDIEWISVDPSGYPIYIAKKKDRFQSFRGIENINSGTFLVWGNKEYKKFESIRGPVIFNEFGIPVYVGRDFKDPEGKIHLIVGNVKTGNAYYNINELRLTPEKKIIFIADINKNKVPITDGLSQNAQCVVYNGIEGKIYASIENLKIYPKDKFIYIAQKKGGEKVIVTNDSEINVQHPGSLKIEILDADILSDGRILYAYRLQRKINPKSEENSYIKSGDEIIGPFLGFPAIKASHYYFQTDYKSNFTISCIKRTDDSSNIKDYIYSNTGISNLHDAIFYINFYRGKVFYEGADNSGRNYYGWKERIYYDFKPVSPEYDEISPTYAANSNFKFDDSAGILTFVGLRDYKFYDVEIKF